VTEEPTADPTGNLAQCLCSFVPGILPLGSEPIARTSSTLTVPAFSNTSVALKWSPALSGFFKPTNMMCKAGLAHRRTQDVGREEEQGGAYCAFVSTSKPRNLRVTAQRANETHTQSKYYRKSNGPTIVWLKSKRGWWTSNNIIVHLLISGCSTVTMRERVSPCVTTSCPLRQIKRGAPTTRAPRPAGEPCES
jgi:hypothetical protein